MKKKLLSIAIVLAMVLALMPATALAAGPEGYWSEFVTAEPETGYVADTVAKTVEISTADGLAWFARQVNEGTSFADYEITIANDIDLSEHYWDPISTSTYSYVSGKWTNNGEKRLDGAVISGEGNVTISGVYTNTALRGPNYDAATSSGQSCYYYSGFIGSNNGDLTIKNITFSGADIQVTKNDEATPDVDVRKVGESSLAVIAGYNGGNLSLENVTVTGSEVTGYTKIAGFVGQQSGSITVKDCAVTNCTFNITGCEDDPYGAFASPITGFTANSSASKTQLNGVVLSGNKVNDTTDWDGNKEILEDGTITGIIEGRDPYIIWSPWAVNGGGSVFEPVASIGDDKYYFTLDGAFEAAEDNETIKLFDDIEFSDTIVLNEDKTITLDLNGKTASYTGADKTYAIELSGGADLVIDDTAEGGKITADNYRVVKLGNSDNESASLTLNGGTVSTEHIENDGDEKYHCAITVCADRTIAQDSNASCKVTVNDATVNGGIYLFGKGAEVEVNKGAVIKTTGSYAISGNGTVNETRNDGNTAITINGGTITQSTVNGAAIYQPQAGTIHISGDPVITGVVGIQLCSGEGIITGGTIKATGSDERGDKENDGYIPDGAAISVVDRNYPGGAPKLTISGGTFDSEYSKAVLAYKWDGAADPNWEDVKDYLKISGGEFSSTVEAYLATGYDCEVGDDGMFSIVSKTPSVTKYRVIEETAENGEVSVNYTLAAKDQKITITVKPDEGFVLSELKVVYGSTEINLTKVDDTTYTFNMPAGDVTVKATFTEKEQGPEKLPFLDTDEDAWYYDAVSFVYNKGLMIGDDDASTIFAPSRHTTRAEYVTILYRMAGEPEVDGNVKFEDVSADDWYADAAEWAYENKIVLGYSDTEYGPNDVIRREDAATILYRYAEYCGYDTSARADLSGYGDVDEISDYAMEAMQWVNAEGFIIGDNVVLEPNRGTERCELAQILMRVCAKF